jgi:allophanate hydrolase
VWKEIDVLALPTTGTIYRVDQLLADPLTLNANLGHYTTFMNLLDLCGVAVPAGFRKNRTPFGIQLVAPAFADRRATAIGARYGADLPGAAPIEPATAARADSVRLAVVGAHLSGQPLNHQLTGRGARLVRSCRTAPAYRLFALAGTTPAKPGLVHVGAGGGAIEVEVWELSPAKFGAFVAEVPAPLAIGTLELEGGDTVKGFVCEPRATQGATDITAFGGWRAWLGGRVE